MDSAKARSVPPSTVVVPGVGVVARHDESAFTLLNKRTLVAIIVNPVLDCVSTFGVRSLQNFDLLLTNDMVSLVVIAILDDEILTRDDVVLRPLGTVARCRHPLFIFCLALIKRLVGDVV